MAPLTHRLDEITRLTGYTGRTIRYYVELGLLPGPESRGVGTRYTREQLGRLLAIQHLRKTERLRLAAIKRRLGQMSPAEIDAFVAAAVDPPPEAPARASAPLPYAATQWDHVALLPGLELRVRSDAGPLIRRLAQEIHAQFGASAQPAEQRAHGDD